MTGCKEAEAEAGAEEDAFTKDSDGLRDWVGLEDGEGLRLGVGEALAGTYARKLDVFLLPKVPLSPPNLVVTWLINTTAHTHKHSVIQVILTSNVSDTSNMRDTQKSCKEIRKVTSNMRDTQKTCKEIRKVN